MARGNDQREKQQRFNLVTGQDSYSGQNAQNPATSRRLQSLIPSLAGELVRELPNPTYADVIGSEIGFLFEYDKVNSDGSVSRFYFCATSTELFLSIAGDTWIGQTLPLPDGTSSVTPLVAYPQAVVTNNLMHLSDGANTWLFDGTAWVLEGMNIPQNAVSVLTTSMPGTVSISAIHRRSGTVTVTFLTPLSSLITGTIPYPVTVIIAGCTDTSLNGTFILTSASSTVFTYNQPGLQDTDDTTGNGQLAPLTVTTNKYYWLSFLDETDGRGLEQSDVTPTSAGTGALGGTTVVAVNPRFGNASISNATTLVTLNNAPGGGGSGPTNETRNPTAFVNPFGAFGTIAFSSVTDTSGSGDAFAPTDGSNFVKAACEWFPFAAASGAYSALALSVTSSATVDRTLGGGSASVLVQYSTDGINWHTIYQLSSGPSLNQHSGTDTVILPPGLDLATLRVSAVCTAYKGASGTMDARVTVSNIFTTGTLAGTSGGAGTGGLFTQADVGQELWIAGNDMGTIANVVNQFSANLTNIWNGGNLTGNWLVAPRRATHWVLYASESENSQIGFQLATIPINVMQYIDTSPFVGATGSLYTPIERPVRNDPPVASLIQTLHKNRIFRRRETNPRFANFTAYEEVLGNLNGSPQECTPGTAPNTLSDIVNEDPTNDDSVQIRAITSHGDAAYFHTEKNTIPLYGQSIDSFTLSNLVAFKVGCAGRYASVSTPHGLCFVSYDKKVYLYPSQYPPGAFGGDSTQYLIELSRPLRTTFENMLSSNMDNVHLVFYNYGRRNWLVLAYRDKQFVDHTWVYDFETQGWFELQRGVVSLAVFETAQADKILVGGDTAQVWVLDDLTGTYTSNANLPAATFRPALINWGKPDHYHIFRYVEFEVDNVNIGIESITVNYWVDPVNVDNPGTPTGTLVMSQVKGSNFFRGFTKGGALCYRMFLEIAVASDLNAGVIRGINIVADEAASLIF